MIDLLEDIEERLTLAREARVLRVYRGRLRTAPDCRDPDHPGCPRCEPDEPWLDEPLHALYPDYPDYPDPLP